MNTVSRRLAFTVSPAAVLLAGILALLLIAGCQPQPASQPAPPPAQTAQQPPAAATLPDITRLAERAGPAVVNISTERSVGGGGLRDFFQYYGGPGSPFEDFFRHLEPLFPPSRPRTQSSLGSGFLIDPSGLVVTNAHVVEGSRRITVLLQGEHEDATQPGQGLDARIVGVDRQTDVALVRIETGRSMPYLTLGDSSRLQVGEWVVAIGNPFGLDHTVTIGIVSAKNRTIEDGGATRYIQTDASINPGNSGGPLLNLRGEVVGVNTAIVASGQGIGFAVPSDTVRQAIARIRNAPDAGGHAGQGGGHLGVRTQDMDAATARALGLGQVAGVLVTSVDAGSAAQAAGIRRGDVLLALDGAQVQDSADLARMVRAHPPGSRVSLTVYRRGRSYLVRVQLGGR